MEDAPSQPCSRCSEPLSSVVLRGVRMDYCEGCNSVLLAAPALFTLTGAESFDAAVIMPAGSHGPAEPRQAAPLPFVVETAPPPIRMDAIQASVKSQPPAPAREPDAMVSGGGNFDEIQPSRAAFSNRGFDAAALTPSDHSIDFDLTPSSGFLEERRRLRFYKNLGLAAVGAIALVLMATSMQRAPLETASTDQPALSEVLVGQSSGRFQVEQADPAEPPAEDAEKPAVELAAAPGPKTPQTPAAAPPQTIRVVQAPGPSAVAPPVQPASAPTPVVVSVQKVGSSGTGVKMGYDSLVSAGWSRVNSAPDESVRSFSDALKLRPGDIDASYGLGYALHRAGRTAEGLPYLCKARTGASADDRAEIEGILGRSGLSCAP